jgi:hypothetical protein
VSGGPNVFPLRGSTRPASRSFSLASSCWCPEARRMGPLHSLAALTQLGLRRLIVTEARVEIETGHRLSSRTPQLKPRWEVVVTIGCGSWAGASATFVGARHCRAARRGDGRPHQAHRRSGRPHGPGGMAAEPPPHGSRSTRTPMSRAHRRRTGGEHPATRRQQLTRNDSKRQGHRRSRRIAAGQEMAMHVFTRQLSKASM